MNVRLLCLSAAVLTSGCAAAGQSGDTPSRMDVISEAEIADLNVSTAMDAVRRLRPAWLRGSRGGERPVVYIDRARRGGFELLSNLPIDVVLEIRHMSPTEATTLLGTGHSSGAILVTTKR